MYIDRFSYEEMAHMIMEDGKSHSRPSASWRLRKAGVIGQSKSKDLRTRRAEDVAPRPREEKTLLPQLKQSGRGMVIPTFLCLLLCSGPQWIGRCSPVLVTCIGEGNLLH